MSSGLLVSDLAKSIDNAIIILNFIVPSNDLLMQRGCARTFGFIISAGLEDQVIGESAFHVASGQVLQDRT